MRPILPPAPSRCTGGFFTTHSVANAEQAWRVVEWYKRRWLIEQFFRILKTQGLRLEDSQVATADRLLKLVAIAAKAAVITIQLLQARDGRTHQPVQLAFDANGVATPPSTEISKLKASGSETRIHPTVLPGQHGSSDVLAAGTAIPRPNRQAPSP